MDYLHDRFLSFRKAGNIGLSFLVHVALFSAILYGMSSIFVAKAPPKQIDLTFEPPPPPFALHEIWSINY